ncbi:MAG: phosphotransferase [Gammaproteobacteria bacterium]|nr:phosphotransferase [Gammaproteobacteria bacterium]
MSSLLTDQLLLQVINKLPSFNEITIENISRLAGGLCNVNVLVEQQNSSQVIRFLTAVDLQNGVDREREFNHQRLAANSHFTPVPRQYYTSGQLQQLCGEQWHQLTNWCHGIMIVDYCSGRSLASLKVLNSAELKALANLVAGVHQIPNQEHMIAGESVSPFKRLSDYWHLCTSNNEQFKGRHQIVVTELINRLKELTSHTYCLIHGDINRGNIIVGATQLWLIDWEFSAFNDPYIDLASVMVELKLAAQDRAQFIAQYAQVSFEVDQARLQLFECYYCAMCWLWLQLQPNEMISNADGEYYYRRMLELSNSLAKQ